MQVTDKSYALNETIQQMGFDSVENFALEKAKESLLKDVAASMKKIAFFQDKYGMDYIDFCKQFQSLSQTVFEKEEDSAEWNAEIKQREIMLKKLSRLD